MADLTKLKPIVRSKCEKLCELVEKELGFKILITSTFRSFEEQHKLFTQVPQVTKADAGYSYHNYGLAFDFVPMINGKPDWENLENFKKVGEIGKKLGLEWGGDWENFVDMPHFQYVLDYKGKPASVFFTDYNDGKIDWSKWDLPEDSLPKEEEKNVIPKILQSSQNPKKLSLFFTAGTVAVIVSFLKSKGIEISEEDFNLIVQNLDLIIPLVLATYGAVRKIKVKKN